MIKKRINTLKNISTAAAILLAGTVTSGFAAPANIQAGKPTSQPIGHYEFCKIYNDQCSVRTSRPSTFKLTKPRWRELVEINAYSNTKISPITDMDYHGVMEKWSFPTSHGDCEDFVLMKRHMLIEKGWPASSLLITVVRQPNGEGHAVLMARTDRGDFILDNLNQKIEIWHETEYTYLKRQMPSHTGRWEDLIDSRAVLGSVK